MVAVVDGRVCVSLLRVGFGGVSETRFLLSGFLNPCEGSIDTTAGVSTAEDMIL